MKISICWFRRDLRLEDHTALFHALESGVPVLCLFIFDRNILGELKANDPRVSFIYDNLLSLHKRLVLNNSSFLVKKGDPLEVWKEMFNEFDIASVYINRDYEPYAIKRDQSVKLLLANQGIPMLEYKDQVVHEINELVKKDGTPYTVFTPYKRKWIEAYLQQPVKPLNQPSVSNYFKYHQNFPLRAQLGLVKSSIQVRSYDLSVVNHYEEGRNFPAMQATSHLSPHLRFGTVGIRTIINSLLPSQEVFLSELIWREFFMQILYHFPQVVSQNFKAKYNGITWLNNEKEFEDWCLGETGYPLVDAGMRQLNETGTMHNRVRMVTASFLCKHLLVDWRWGEAYFAGKLLDYELSSNNGNWQWAAGTGCDAAPYFRIFNPIEQLKRFDKNLEYVRTWIPEYDPNRYKEPIVEHKTARVRALKVYRQGLENYTPRY